MKIRSTFDCKIDVDFQDPAKAQAYFIDGDWRDFFYAFDNLEEVTEHLALNFHKADEYYDHEGLNRSIEGFGSYVYQPETHEWRLSEDAEPDEESLDCGMIVIRYEQDLKCSDIEKLPNQ
ncbi:hypothetical protein OTK49_02485 [Vibrio coralliirubri]|uniref:hypothetical protein n=1 Tax=Vibrio coralliirubri TaxID=1516159 RepID=UPI0022852267|nr:hypothetical protein [Vibrio coralliirubri]MCY9861384.1 hypothetical protein [Vibrio coralliirubri]